MPTASGLDLRSFFAYDVAVSVPPMSSGSLRAEISARNRLRGEAHPHEASFGRTSHVVYGPEAGSLHGNFLPAVYRRILANMAWSRRLAKAYTGSAQLPRAADRSRGELECANSSDALLMNVFCYPRLLHRPAVRALLGIELNARAEFGVRAHLPMRNDEVDRTEVDLRIGSLLVEAKLTEGGFGVATRDRLLRYTGVEDVFCVESLPWSSRGVQGYQLIRGVLAASRSEARFALLCDGRRADLVEVWFRVLCSVMSTDLRSRMALHTWQEVAAASPPALRRFLAEKYGIEAAG